MPETLSLFDTPEVPLKQHLREGLRELAAQQIFLGASSWKYEGWLGSIYTPERYRVRGRFSQKRFEQECLAEYGDVFPIVCGDFAFYQFPSAEFWRKLFTSAAPPLQFAFKVPEEITVPLFPNHRRYGARAGQRNPSFLSIELFEQQFAALLRPYADRTALLIFEFPASTERAFPNVRAFAERLASFLAKLKGPFRYAVELRVADFLDVPYMNALRDHGVAHVFNSWTAMPSLSEQIERTEAFTAGFTAVRALLSPGRPYDDAVRLFSPYSAVREPNAEVRAALRALLARAKRRTETTFAFINNRLEGFAPGTIAAVIEDL